METEFSVQSEDGLTSAMRDGDNILIIREKEMDGVPICPLRFLQSSRILSVTISNNRRWIALIIEGGLKGNEVYASHCPQDADWTLWKKIDKSINNDNEVLWEDCVDPYAPFHLILRMKVGTHIRHIAIEDIA